MTFIIKYNSLTQKDFKNIKINFNEADYNIFNDKMLDKIGKKLYVRN